MKSAWVTALKRQEDLMQQTMAELNRYGLAPQGHFWVDDLPAMAWREVLEQMRKKPPAVWVILTSAEAIAEPNLRYGISLLSLALRTHLGPLPTAILSTSESPPAEMAPAVLNHALPLSLTQPAWAAKLVALASRPADTTKFEYYLDASGDRQVGQWFEVGPAGDPWDGALFAVASAEIDFHAVGSRGKLPERATLNFAQKGLKLEANGVEHTAWAVRNALSATESYFLRVRGEPSAILFGPYPEGDAGDVFALRLK